MARVLENKGQKHQGCHHPYPFMKKNQKTKLKQGWLRNAQMDEYKLSRNWQLERKNFAEWLELASFIKKIDSNWLLGRR